MARTTKTSASRFAVPDRVRDTAFWRNRKTVLLSLLGVVIAVGLISTVIPDSRFNVANIVANSKDDSEQATTSTLPLSPTEATTSTPGATSPSEPIGPEGSTTTAPSSAPNGAASSTPPNVEQLPPTTPVEVVTHADNTAPETPTTPQPAPSATPPRLEDPPESSTPPPTTSTTSVPAVDPAVSFTSISTPEDPTISLRIRVDTRLTNSYVTRVDVSWDPSNTPPSSFAFPPPPPGLCGSANAREQVVSPTHTYERAGTHNVALSITLRSCNNPTIERTVIRNFMVQTTVNAS